MRKEIKTAFGHIHEAVAYIENHSIENKTTLDPSFKEKITVAANDIFAEMEELESEVVDFKGQIDELEIKLQDTEKELSDFEERADNAEHDLDEIALPRDTVYDQMKNKILSNMAKNLSLDQLESLEAVAKSYVKNYVTLD